MKLTHIGISNFRSIGEDFVTIDLTKKINVLVGANNCGKSNVLKGIEVAAGRGAIFGTLREVDGHRRSNSAPFTFLLRGKFSQQPPGKPLIEHEVRFTCVPDGADDIRVTSSSLENLSWRDFEPIRNQFANNRYSSHPSNSQVTQEKTHTALRFARELRNRAPQYSLIPVFRRIGEEETYKFSGEGVVKLLARWKQPEIGHDGDEEKFTSIQKLLRELTGNHNITLQIPPTQKEIVVVNGGLRLPLSSYGTGIHELIILAIAVLSHDNALVCIEEPEIHLHPLLQRRFLDFLRKETTNRYVITTHSSALIALNAETAVSHLWLENGVTKSRLIETTEHSLGALRDLGAKASDILQANSVIWVEGPSDRIYLNCWFELLYPDQFREGIDYSIMFYGGRLLSHVSLERDVSAPDDDSDDADDLVQLLRINQHSAIVIDSDRRKATDPLNATKLRVQEQCEASKIPCWITDGREIENYLPAAVLNATYGELSGSKPEIKPRAFGAIEDALKKALEKDWPRANYYDQAKPKMARLISAKTTKSDLTPDIIAWMEKLVRVIRHDTP